MSTHNICFRGEIRKISILLDCKKSALTSAMLVFLHKGIYCGYIKRQRQATGSG